MLSTLPGGATDTPVRSLARPPGLDPSDDCNADGILDAADDLVIETADGAQSLCAADNNTP